MVRPALRHLKHKIHTENLQSKLSSRTPVISMYSRTGVRPADVVDGNVSELLVHGRLVFPARQEIEGRLGVLVGHIYPNFPRALKIERQKKNIKKSSQDILYKPQKHRGLSEQLYDKGKHSTINNLPACCVCTCHIPNRGSISAVWHQCYIITYHCHFTLAESRKLCFFPFTILNFQFQKFP